MQLAAPAFNTRAPAASLGSLLLLGAAVLAAHLLVLQEAAVILDTGAPPITRPFITRMMPAAPAVPKPAPVKRVARAPKPPAPAAPPAATPVVEIQPETPVPAADSSPSTDSAAALAPQPAASAPAVDASAPQPMPPAAEAPQQQPVNVPGSLRLNYKIHGEISKLTYHASGELLWLHDGKTYDARLEVGAFLLGSRVQTSSGRITPEGLAPTRFGDKVRSEVAAHFERDKGKITFSANTPDVALQPGAQDQLSIFIQLASMIAGDPARYPKGATLEMQAVGAREAETWRFIVGDEERLQLPAGEQVALRLTRVSEKTFDVTVEVWLAPALGYLPVRIRLTQNNGDFIEQQLRSSETP